MALETTVLLRTILLQVLKAEDLDEVREDIEAMCSKDDISSVMEIYRAWRKRKEEKQQK